MNGFNDYYFIKSDNAGKGSNCIGTNETGLNVPKARSAAGGFFIYNYIDLQ